MCLLHLLYRHNADNLPFIDVLNLDNRFDNHIRLLVSLQICHGQLYNLADTNAVHFNIHLHLLQVHLQQVPTTGRYCKTHCMLHRAFICCHHWVMGSIDSWIEYFQWGCIIMHGGQLWVGDRVIRILHSVMVLSRLVSIAITNISHGLPMPHYQWGQVNFKEGRRCIKKYDGAKSDNFIDCSAIWRSL